MTPKKPDADSKGRKELFVLCRGGEGNVFPFLTDVSIEATHYFARGFHDAADMLIQALKSILDFKLNHCRHSFTLAPLFP
jgi:hypothetical protein